MEKYGRILIIYSYLKYEDREIWIWIVHERIVARDINGNVITNLILILAGIESWPGADRARDSRYEAMQFRPRRKTKPRDK